MLIRDYDPSRDLEPCLAIWRRASEVGHPLIDAATLDADAALVREHYMPAAAIRVAEAEERPAGFIALLDSFIGGLFVDPAAHGRGVGRSLVRDALRDRSVLDVEVYEANAGARAFYARLGFRETGRREADDQGRPWPLLRLRLGAGPGTRATQPEGQDRRLPISPPPRPPDRPPRGAMRPIPAPASGAGRDRSRCSCSWPSG